MTPSFTRRQVHRVLTQPREDDYNCLAANGRPVWIDDFETTPFHCHRPELGPNRKLMYSYSDGMDQAAWESWTDTYRDQFDHGELERICEELIQGATEDGKQRVALCCFEPPSARCHVYSLLDAIERLGYEVEMNRPTRLTDF